MPPRPCRPRTTCGGSSPKAPTSSPSAAARPSAAPRRAASSWAGVISSSPWRCSIRTWTCTRRRGRGMKVGREEIVGLLVALRRFVASDHRAAGERQRAQLETILDALGDTPGVRAGFAPHADDHRGYPVLVVRLDEAVLGRPAETIVSELLEGEPAIGVSQQFLRERAIGVVASTLHPGEEAVVARRLREVLRPRTAPP